MPNNLTPCACLGPQFGEPFCPCVMKNSGLPRSTAQQEYYSDANVSKREKELEEQTQKLDLFINDAKERRRNRYLKHCFEQHSYPTFANSQFYDLSVPLENRKDTINIRYDGQPLLISTLLNNGKHALLIWLDQKDTTFADEKTDIYLLTIFPEKEQFNSFLEEIKNSFNDLDNLKEILTLLLNVSENNSLEYVMEHKTVFSSESKKDYLTEENTVKLYHIERKDVVHWIQKLLKTGVDMDKIGAF